MKQPTIKKPPWYTTETFWRILGLIGTLASIAGMVISLLK
jgi:hypothetical protein